MMNINHWAQKNRDNMYSDTWKFSSRGYTNRYYPILRDVFINRVVSIPESPEKEFSETESFANASEALRRIAKQVADYIRYELEVKGDIVLDYDPELEEIFIHIKPKFYDNSRKKIELEKKIITRISKEFLIEDIWDINIMVE